MASLEEFLAANNKSVSFNEPWGDENKIVIGVDIGTTQSGVAFVFLEQGIKPLLHRVTSWPGQEARNQQSKVPSVIWYDANGKAVSFGAQALSPSVEDDAIDNGWALVKHFKLHLHPEDLKTKDGHKPEPLPLGVSLRQVYSDFLGYLLKHAKSYFEDRIIRGDFIWRQHVSTMELVIAHPNGWGIREQTFLREIAMSLGFSDNKEKLSNIRFVTEAEASVHFCIYHTNLASSLQPEASFAVCDAGGSTVDTTLYSIASKQPVLKLKEKCASACVKGGGIFVDAAAEKYLRNTLASAGLSGTDIDEYAKQGARDFEINEKRAFCDEKKEYYLQITYSRVNIQSIRIRRGRMILPGLVIKAFFQVQMEQIFASVDEQIKHSNVSQILLVGGFGDSPYLRSQFKERYEPRGCQVVLTNDSTSKAVAEGAVIWNTISSVVSRAPRYSFGLRTNVKYSPQIYEHQVRKPFVQADGQKWIPGSWSPIVRKGEPLDSDSVCRRRFSRFYSTATPNLGTFEERLLAYKGESQPSWVENEQGILDYGFEHVCYIPADFSNLPGALERRTMDDGSTHWRLRYDVCICFGGTELGAYLEWNEHGVTRTSRVTIIPNDPI